MINLITGLPGNGKTLFAIGFIKKWAERENRPVFYSGVNLTDEGKALGWTEIDATEWYKCPPGAIVFIDEAQRIFRPRMHGKEVPKHVAELETHRHAGMDLVLITQHPMLIDNEVRRLAGNHRHVVRMMGTQRATIHEWTEVRQDCEKGPRRSDSEKTVFTYDREVYGLYKSAELHTMKRKIPKIVYVVALLPFIVLAGVFYVYQFGKKVTSDPNIPGSMVSKDAPASSADKPPGALRDTKTSFDPEADLRNFVAVNTPRIAGLPHTAPKYDEVTKPTAAPVPSACVSTQKRCQCYTQQGTRMDVEYNQCLEIAHNGFFEEFDTSGHSQKRQGAIAALDRPDGALPLSKADTNHRPYVASFGDTDGYGVLGRRTGSALPANSAL